MPHPSFKLGDTNDILVVKTDHPFQLTQRVKTIKLAKYGNDPQGNLVSQQFARLLESSMYLK